MINVGLLAIIEAKPEYATDVEQLLTSAQKLAEEETGTVVWYAFKIGPTTFGIFDAFHGEEDRKAHLNGPIAAALMEIAPVKLASPPQIQPVNLLGAKTIQVS